MAYCRFGRGAGTLVILPGLSLTAVTAQESALEQAFSRFTDEFTVYVFDRRENIAAGASLESFALDISAALKSFGVASACVFGASQGGMIALALAALEPPLVERLVLASAACDPPPQADELLRHWAHLAQSGDTAALADSFIEHLYATQTIAAAGAALRETLAAATPQELQQFAAAASARFRGNTAHFAQAITAKCLVTGSFGDAVFGADALVETARALNCAAYLYPATYGHAVYDEAPDFRSRLYEFFTRE